MLDKIKINLPEKEEGIKNFFCSCEERKKFVEDVDGYYAKRLKKAKHDLNAANSEFRERNWDWTIVKAYYSMHHAGNALLSKEKKLFSKDHSCLIIALKYYNLIGTELFDKLSKIASQFHNTLSMDIAFGLRKISQYDVDKWEEITEDDAEKVLKISKEFVFYVEGKIC
jgi:uncharacterized protein (UPF0332 family)